MAPDINFPTSEEQGLALGWSRRLSLTLRILAVNILALALLAAGFFYLDSFRAQILDARTAQASREVRLIAQALRVTPPERRDALIVQLARGTGSRVRL